MKTGLVYLTCAVGLELVGLPIPWVVFMWAVRELYLPNNFPQWSQGKFFTPKCTIGLGDIT